MFVWSFVCVCLLCAEAAATTNQRTAQTTGAIYQSGFDMAFRLKISNTMFAGMDINSAYGQYLFNATGSNNCSLPPLLCSHFGLTMKTKKGLGASLQYRILDDHPIVNSNSLSSPGFCFLNAAMNYEFRNISFCLSAENLLNLTWRPSLPAEEYNYRADGNSISEVKFSPDTPFYVMGSFAVAF